MSASTIHISSHPCLQAKLSQLRSASTHSSDVKRLVHEIGLIVGCEALAQGLQTSESGTDESPLGYAYPTTSIAPAHISIVPILRSGLSMVDAVSTLLPYPVPVHHLGMYREKTTLQPVEYYNNLPYHSSSSAPTSLGPSDLAILVDPIIATGSTVCAAIETLRDWGVKKIITISVLGSQAGLERAAEAWPEGVELWVGGVDAGTDERGMIKPGLGDIGDRLFLTVGK
ncbi:uracil phosphoribosyltransferase [Polychaeton citri CBS 116435]|uniref:uracil phosphoribosyltransferase n=1 Tax=Polychaeton citri CBS 116435 TaxID=1314669 RepID=A0A9P4QDD9_9PEZI|nr:uracil phosphoribosyltransferase [Polychaeton citri CBS 116435]